jgi:tetratricopeptide (TPR) repeat protein
MKAVPAEQAYGVYLEQRKTFGRSPAFYLDCADYLVEHGQRDLGVRVLTDIAELQLQDARLLRVAAHRLMQISEASTGSAEARELAIDLFEKVLALRPEEPQSYRDLALALAGRAQLALSLDVRNSPGASPAALSQAKADYGRALDLLNKVIVGNWPRFPEIELPVLMEANQIIAALAGRPDLGEVPDPIDGRLRKDLDCDVRVVLTWDADQTDIDLWVTEPSNERCFYGHNRTIIGGLLSRDYTDGYGPEEYCLRKLMPGQYRIQANFYGSRQQELTGPATVQATVITNFGRPNEKRQSLTVRLKEARDVVDIGAITLGPGADATARPATQPARAELNK